MKQAIFFVWVLAAMWFTTLLPAGAADAASNAVASVKQDETNSEIYRTFIQLQEQLHATQLLIRRDRENAEAEALRQSEALNNRLQGIEKSLDLQRSRELDAMQASNRVMLMVAGSFAGVGFVAMLLMAYFQWRTVARLAEMSAGLPAFRALPPSSQLALPVDTHPVDLGSASQATSRFTSALERLEQRIRDLEVVTRPTLKAPAAIAAPVPSEGNGTEGHHAAPAGDAAALLASAVALLQQDQAEAALTRLEQVLASEPRNTEALLKKASALERLNRFTQAVECYDQALAIDGTLTIAYLCKGGLYNRLERFSEALDCYEKALHAHEQRATTSDSLAAN